MKKPLITLGLLLITLQLSATVLNKLYVDKETNFTITDSPVAQINDYLLFNQVYNFEIPFQKALYAMHNETQEVTKLLAGSTSNTEGSEHFIKLENYVYFTNHQGLDTTVWRTDGTPAGTTQIYDNGIISGLRVSNGLLYFVEKLNGQIVTYDGSHVVVHPVFDIGSEIDDVCAFTVDNIIAIGFVDGVDGPYVRSNGGLTTALEIEVPVTIGGFGLSLTSHMGRCYTYVPNFEGGTDIWRFNADGSSQLLQSLQEGYTNGLLSHQNHLYIKQTSDQFTGFKISRLSQDETALDRSFGDLDSQDLAITDWAALGDFIAIRTTTPNESPAIDSVFILTPDLADYPRDQIMFPTAMPRALATQDGWIIHTSQSINNVSTENRLHINPFSENQRTLLLPKDAEYQFTSDANQAGVYMLAYDGYRTTLYQTAEQPDIGPIITGGWYNPELENQGLNIIQGKRANGSEYVSVTGYTFKQELPFWFAGNADFQTPQNNIDVELFEFSGIGLFEADSTPQRTVFGTINLQLNGCNQLQSTITTDGEVFEILLYRADDVNATQNCVD